MLLCQTLSCPAFLRAASGSGDQNYPHCSRRKDGGTAHRADHTEEKAVYNGQVQDILCPGEHQDDRTGHGKECLVYQAELGSLRVRLQHFFLAAIRGAIGAVVHLFQDFPRSRRQRNRYGGRAKCQREDGAEHEYPKRAAVSITRKAHQGSGNCGFIFVVTVHSVFPHKILFFPTPLQ